MNTKQTDTGTELLKNSTTTTRYEWLKKMYSYGQWIESQQSEEIERLKKEIRDLKRNK